ncbi:MAG: (Fe-S)-binding protein [Promethearchaeota archaeon]
MDIPEIKRSKMEDELFICSQCGYCTAACPPFRELTAKWESAGPRGKLLFMKNLFLGKDKINRTFAENAFKCSLCGYCKEVCQVSIDLVTFWQSVRAEVFRNNLWPAPLYDLKSSLQEEYNVYNISNEDRTIWSYEVEDLVEDHLNRDAEIGYFVGCVSSFTGRLASIPESFVKILNHLSVDFALLGKEEWCCGSPYFLSGAYPLAKELAEHNIKTFERLGIKTLITTCAGCYRAWKVEYPHLGQELPFEVKHAVEYLAELVDLKKLILKKVQDLKTTYHDPCELGRISGVFEAPRKILNSISEFVELPKIKQESRCCGAGGVLKITNPELALKVGFKKIDEIESLENLGVDTVVSACPACQLNIDEAIRERKSHLKMRDITQIVAQALGL